ncbi:MAG: multidrug effflux MFS transporter [Coxiellaceae bacterium]|nr:multidrug effflux MFS transporter [Coxiellaceae bacterium]
MTTRSHLSRLTIPFLVFLLAIAANFPLDIQVPAMPIISRQLGISISQTQLTVSLFLLGYGLFPLLYGGLSDAFGRRKVVVLALVVLITGSALCALASNAAMLLVGRFIQGAGTAGCMAVPRAIMRDSFRHDEMARVSSYMGVAIELSLALSPVIGGTLVQHFGWHSNFIFVVVLALLVLVCVLFYLKESNAHIDRHAIKLRNMMSSCKSVITNRTFIRYNLCSASAFSCCMAYFTISPFVIQDNLHYSAQDYGLLNLFVTGAVVLGSLMNALCVKRFGIARMAMFGLILLLLSGVILLLLALIGPLILLGFLLPSMLAFFAIAFLFSNCISGSMRPFAKQAGMAGSVYSMIQTSSAFIVTTIISLAPHDNGQALAITFVVLSALALWNFLSTRNRVQA